MQSFNFPKQKGVAIITVLMIVTLAISISTYLIWIINNRIEIHDMQYRRLQSRLIAQAGIEWAGSILLDDFRTTGDVDSLNEIWAQTLPALPVRVRPEDPTSSVVISGKLTDETSKFNINNLAFDDSNSNYNLESFKKLLVTLNIPIVYANYITDWVDNNDELIDVNSAESDFYLKEQPPYRAANQPLSEIGNLSKVRDINENILKTLEPYITFLPKITKVNINTASAEVLAAVVPDLTYAQALTIVEDRKAKPFTKVSEFVQLFSEDLQERIPIKNLSVSSIFFTAKVEAFQDDNLIRAEALMERVSGRWPIIWWQKIY